MIRILFLVLVCLQGTCKNLEDPSYIELKRQLTEYLAGSWCSSEKTALLMDLMMVEKPKVCAEIGVFSGYSALPVAVMLKFLDRGKLYAIDAWSNYEAIKYLPDNDPNKEWWGSIDMQWIYQSFLYELKKWDVLSQCMVIRDSSFRAAKRIDGIDFLHIDGNFSKEGSLDDVRRYLPKVRKGGHILYSNLFLVSNGTCPRKEAFQELLEKCVIVQTIENNNCILVKKIFD